MKRILSFLIFLTLGVTETDIYVDSNIDQECMDEGCGFSDNPYKTITRTLEMINPTVNNPIIIHLAGGTYSTETGESFPIILSSNLNIAGENEKTTIIDAMQTDRVINIENSQNNTISDVTITGGSSERAFPNNRGGGMYLAESHPTLFHVTISGNTASTNGGGMYLTESHPTLSHVTISENKTSDYGGGMYLYDSHPTLTHLTISRNKGNYGGGMFIESSHPILTNSIIWDNNSEAIFLFIVNEQPIITYSDIEGGWEGEGNINNDPLFTNPENSIYTLKSGSPCIDTGTSDVNGDELGDITDFIGIAPDMGVYEGGTGCIDSEAINYDSEANLNEGCVYYDVGALNIFISEYIEGSLQIRAIEVYNPTNSAINLFGFELWIINSGGDWIEGSGYNEIFPEHVLEPGDVFVFCGSNFSEECDFIDILPFGGDDVVGLVYDGTVIDQVGSEGDDPGSGWIVSGIENATNNHTLLRNPNVLSGDMDWGNSSQSGWIVHDQDVIEYLGYHTVNNGYPISGDTNFDGIVDILDIVQIVNYITGNLEFSDDEFIAADYNADDIIDILDIVQIINYILR